MAAKDVPDNRILPKKEQDLFRSTVKFYETKQYKKGLKAADSVLKKFPTHGETMAMKGLLLNCLERREEAHENVKRGLALDVKSHVCWHVYGLLHRSDRNYTMAIKCYLNALRIDTENRQILRDLSLLQIQMRDLRGFMETRRKILVLQSNNRPNWVTYAMSNHLQNNYEQALNILDSFLQTQKDRVNEDTPTEKYEDSELLMYKNLIMEEQERFQDALDHLEECRPKILDHVSWRSKRGELLLKLQHYEEAKSQFRDLLNMGPDNYDWHRRFQCAVLQLSIDQCNQVLALKYCDLPSKVIDLSDEQKQLLKREYDAMISEGLRGLAPTRIPLSFLGGEELRNALKAYIEKSLRKGVPALGSDLSSLYMVESTNGSKNIAKDPYDLRNNSMLNLVAEITDEIIESLTSTSKFPGASDESDPETPTTLLWAMYLKVQHHEMRAEYDQALPLIERCIEHTPTAIDMYLRKARILKKMGDYNTAADVVEHARQMDLSDRYTNNKTTKYLLRADRVQQAQDTIALFTRHEGDPQYNLYEMQCSWYELEWAESQLRQGNIALALKKFLAVEKHFVDFQEDQFDFHTYCMRKCTFRSYLGMLRWEDTVCDNKLYERAAKGIVGIYLSILERPEVIEKTDEADYSKMTPQEKKRAKTKARKAAKKAAKAAEEAAKNQAESENSNDDKKKKGARMDRPIPVDDDPLGEKAAAKDPLPECLRFVNTLRTQAPRSISTHLLAFDVSMKRGKILQAMQALVRAVHLYRNHPELVLRIHAFLEYTSSTGFVETSHSTVLEVIRSELEFIAEGKSHEEFVEHVCNLAVTESCLLLRISAARLLSHLNPAENRQRAGALILEGLGGRGVSVKTCKKALGVLSEVGTPEDVASFKTQCSSLFPIVTEFQG